MVEHGESAEGADDGAGPVGAVDSNVDVTAVPRGDHFVDGRVDRGVLAADAHTGDDARAVQEDDPAGAVPGRSSRQRTADEIDAERHAEQVASPELVGEVTEHQRADDLTDQIPRRDVTDRPRRQMQGVLVAEQRPHVRSDRDLETIQDPRHPKRHDHAGVESRPRQPVDPCGDQAPDVVTGLRRWRLRRGHVPLLSVVADGDGVPAKSPFLTCGPLCFGAVVCSRVCSVARRVSGSLFARGNGRTRDTREKDT